MKKKILALFLLMLVLLAWVSAPVEWFWPAPWGGNTHWAGPGRWNGPAGDADGKLALTFDDGPSAYTAQVLDILKAHDARATFFVMGREVERFPEIARRIIEEGHEIGNHTYDFNAQDNKLFSGIALDSIERNQLLINEVTGFSPVFYRSPGGQMGRYLYQAVREQALEVVNGSFPMPHPKLNAIEQLAIAEETLFPGAIIILHDGDDHAPDSDRAAATVEMLPDLLGKMQARGLRSVTVSELLGRTR